KTIISVYLNIYDSNKYKQFSPIDAGIEIVS
mgnify:CR=1